LIKEKDKDKEKKMIFVSGNKNKFSELSDIFSKHNIVLEKVDFDLPEIQSISVKDVVNEKIRYAYEKINQPVIVEDTGLYITSKPMNGFPGALIKFYYDCLGVNGICEKNGGNNAYCETVIGYHDGEQILTFSGIVEGNISREPLYGNFGFGWDPIFIPKNYNLSFAQIEDKNKISMRKIASNKFINYLNKN